MKIGESICPCQGHKLMTVLSPRSSNNFQVIRIYYSQESFCNKIFEENPVLWFTIINQFYIEEKPCDQCHEQLSLWDIRDEINTNDLSIEISE